MCRTQQLFGFEHDPEMFLASAFGPSGAPGPCCI